MIPKATFTIAALFLLTSCASDGRMLQEPSPDQTAATRPTTTVTSTTINIPSTLPLPSESGQTGMLLSSPDFTPGGQAPEDTTCAGENKFPSLQWENIPEGTQEIALTLTNMTDPESPLLVWLAGGISPEVAQLESGFLPDANAFETLNDWAAPGYGTPCLEEFTQGSEEALLQFRIYALSEPSAIEPGAPGNTSVLALKERATETASLLMKYKGDL